MGVSTFAAVISASSLACLVTTVGIYVISRYEEWGKRHSVYFVSFAAGVLISVSLLHIVPESFEMSGAASGFLLAGFLTLYLTNRLLRLPMSHGEELNEYALGIVPVLGIGLHSLVDGIIYSVTFNASLFTGALAAIGMILHEFPEGIITFVLLNRGGLSRRRSAAYAFLAAALSTPLGTLVSYPFVSSLTPSVLGALLGVSAGALLYVGASHLLPEVERDQRRFSFLALAAGVLVAVVMVMSKA